MTYLKKNANCLGYESYQLLQSSVMIISYMVGEYSYIEVYLYIIETEAMYAAGSKWCLIFLGPDQLADTAAMFHL